MRRQSTEHFGNVMSFTLTEQFKLHNTLHLAEFGTVHRVKIAQVRKGQDSDEKTVH